MFSSWWGRTGKRRNAHWAAPSAYRLLHLQLTVTQYWSMKPLTVCRRTHIAHQSQSLHVWLSMTIYFIVHVASTFTGCQTFTSLKEVFGHKIWTDIMCVWCSTPRGVPCKNQTVLISPGLPPSTVLSPHLHIFSRCPVVLSLLSPSYL